MAKKSKKRLVFFGYTMDMGGAERALINVLNVLIKYFEIDLFLIKAEGVLMDDIPKGVNVHAIRKNTFIYALFRYIPFFRKKIINKLTGVKKYDIAVAFMEGRAATWLVDMKQDCKKIGWIHNDVSKFDIGISEKEIRDTYSKLDRVVVVSKHSMDSFIEKYGIDKSRVEVVYNLIDEEGIIKKANKFSVEKNKFTFVNVAKMRPQKRHDRLLEAVSKLKEEGFDFEVLLIGNGPLESEIKEQISKLEIEDYVKLLGLQTNPFPYIKNSDYFVMSSDHEGYPLTLLESLILKTPVVTTDVSGAFEILNGDKYGFICDVSLEALTAEMRKVLINKDKHIKVVQNNLKEYKGANAGIVEQLKELFDIK